MYIKSLVLDGFKSYGHRTEITGFDSQFNAITGLNGSGKSNILDSICFVLGISNLNQVRAASLQDLIYKNGQCGITKATVSVIFDNRNSQQCPPGFDNVPEITITRQILMGGKNKYMINGAAVTNKKVQELFCSVQLNVNNPHFLIMQGKITKVLNMKPHDILGMLEEAAGTGMYEKKKKESQKIIEKKDAKLNELKTVVKEELAPKLEKFRLEKAKYLELKTLERQLEHMLVLFQAWEYVAAQRKLTQAKQVLKEEEDKIQQVETNIKNHKNQIKEIECVVNELIKKSEEEGNESLQKAQAELKENEKTQAKINSTVKSLKEEINSEIKKKEQLEKNIIDEEKTLKTKETELGKVQDMFTKLKDADQQDSQTLAAAQKRYEALSAGMEINDEGEAETLLEQLMKARQEASQANTEMKQATMRLDFCQKQLKSKEQQRLSNAGEMLKFKNELEIGNKEIKDIEAALKRLNFDEPQMDELQTRRRQLAPEVRSLKDKIDRFEARRPYTQFRYRDPEPNFDRRRVYGVVCRLFKVKNEKSNLALETAAGGRLYNVVIDTDVTGKKLLERGQLESRTTFMPLNKIEAHRMSNSVVKTAQSLVGAENVQSALAHITYDSKLQVVMDFVFGNVLICKDLNIAKKLAFDDRISRKCVTLEGDVVDPAGTLSGGAPPKDGSVLKLLDEIIGCEDNLNQKAQELEEIENHIHRMGAQQNEYASVKQKLEMKQHEVNLVNQRLQQTSQYRHQEEITNLRTEIDELIKKIQNCKENESKYQNKSEELENRVKNSKGGRDKQIKDAETEMNKLKAKADKSRKEWKQREKEYEIYNLEIEELKKSLDNTREQIKTTNETIKTLNEKYEEIVTNSEELNENVASLQNQVKKEKSKITEKNKDIQNKIQKKESLQAEIVQFELKIKEHTHNLKKLKDDCQSLKAKQADSEKRAKKANMDEVERMTEQEGEELEKNIRRAQEKKNALSRTINTKAQTLLEQQEREYNELKKKQKIVESDKKKLLQTIAHLDVCKEQVLSRAYKQISTDFGSIFSTLLPGADAKLLPPTGQTILQGLEVKVSLGGVWKDSLTELSGGQRSLAALSLILAMLLFKPAPLYILDEVDAALDLSHTQNIGHMLKTHFKTSQFIIVSLKDGMFSNANVLFKTQFVDGVSTVTRTVNRN